MDALTLPLANRLLVLAAPHAAGPLMLELAARLSRHEWLLNRLPALSRNRTLVRWFTRLID